MMATFFPLKKLRRNTRHLLFLAILLAGLAAVYHEMVASKAWSSDTSMTSDGSSWRRATADEGVRRGQPVNSVEDSTAWRFTNAQQTWKPEYKGQANLHVFEDWCGSSAVDLRRNMHYPLYPHSRTTVQKLAVSPQWTNYGLRIFGYLHPYANGEFVFALSSDDNSELWLSTDDSPLNVEMLAYVGKTGAEWSAPGEFTKYSSQTSKPVLLSMQRRYFFEIIHKQNDRGTDHVEVAWQLLYHDVRFTVISSQHISLYVDESALLLTDVAHIPQTTASHRQSPAKQQGPTTDAQREDRRDSLYQVPLIDSSFLKGILPDCVYKPSYTIKDFPLQRYQGLQFVHMSYIYPNDFTRLTHMETENSCFYPENPSYMKMFGFSRYMRLDRPEKPSQGKGKSLRDFGFQRRKSALEGDYAHDVYHREKELSPEKKDDAHFPDYGDDYDDYVQRRRRKLFSVFTNDFKSTLENTTGAGPTWQGRQKQTNVTQNVSQPQAESQRPAKPVKSTILPTSKHLLHLQQNPSRVNIEDQIKIITPLKPKRSFGQAKRAKVETAKEPKPVIAFGNKLHHINGAEERLGPRQRHVQRAQKMIEAQQKLKRPQLEEEEEEHLVNLKRGQPGESFIQRDTDARKNLREKEIEINVPLQKDVENGIRNPVMMDKEKNGNKWSEPRDEDLEAWAEEGDNGGLNERGNRKRGRDSVWSLGDDFKGTEEEDPTPPPVFDTDVNWSQTFQVNHLDLQAHRSDWIDLRCNVSGNLLLEASHALPIVKAFVEKLNEKHKWQFTLVRVVNVVKRIDGVQGSRYLLELELTDVRGQLLRLSHYIYALTRYSRHPGKDFGFGPVKPQQVLCNPVGFRWYPAATVHFIVPVKNQARWVQQLITDMEQLFRVTGDINFNLIITDYNSTDMDVRKALEKSSLPRYEYVKLSGNFERSAGLQAGIDLINDDHSIVFLCDLHIYFPPSIIDTIRKHCVEGYMAFAPIVLRLDCGATPSEAKGYWEVNGFGLLGIYKSDLDKVGGMNTREFTDRWGGEDWELLDRILQAGMEVERIYLRNFFHHYHSKRGMWNRRLLPKRT
ncbi:LOW QUALITY PROTEIN: beta-1,4-N-acetylgalactosaminyltransferase 3 [Takifugu flavidus]|uniref:LOW QUALITY PROTEIN: beta-1,4-N-acetylgalactosaminyltransferase 3 n=1 Tax=Takifugu flavidus TaxID=433684 RepID=UPI002544B3D4|nr:LOW QUALITY PROTEIN: beta-1,4-N-acetylgalactosaminyltransferase 3 [Takifugu flavidus]